MAARHLPLPDDNTTEMQRRLAILEADISDMKQIREDIQAIRAALVGDKALGHKGIVERIERHEYLLIALSLTLVAMCGERLIHLVLK